PSVRGPSSTCYEAPVFGGSPLLDLERRTSGQGKAQDKPEEGEDDAKSSRPLCPRRHTCYNGRDKGSRSREGELTPKTRPQFGLSKRRAKEGGRL
ncbi:hypothetical protein HAX54_019180, partial [Datura stramonium]|nr:hypothetical protein [Datura stramonium]